MNAGGVLNTCKSNEKLLFDFFGLIRVVDSGERVSNAWVTNLKLGDNTGKLVLIPHICRHGIMIAGKASAGLRRTRVRLVSW